MEGYCVKCKAKREMLGAEEVKAFSTLPLCH
ncbi:MAG: hypothetical protein US92_C0006G0066 [Candidatus Peregrinibacteria bacterium GW2011_GWA2_38_36]|nr:MAG: hypothetical protein US92_C0006G0066 [Candidatus Peregrinibacteria bacterium GW2011_GWA2_38_36]